MAKKAYHHGNLRSAILAAARDTLESSGVEGLSLRKVAQQTGVSPTALYSHFQDKRELLSVLATEGFDSLCERMEHEAARHASQSSEHGSQLAGLARGYVLFAIDNRALFQLMFGREIGDLLDFPNLVKAGSRAYSMMAESVGQAMDVSASPDRRSIGATAAWSTVHGLTMLILDGRITAAEQGASDNGELVDLVCSMLRFGN
jgi:AcrR family transcriptional regulator